MLFPTAGPPAEAVFLPSATGRAPSHPPSRIHGVSCCSYYVAVPCCPSSLLFLQFPVGDASCRNHPRHPAGACCCVRPPASCADCCSFLTASHCCSLCCFCLTTSHCCFCRYNGCAALLCAAAVAAAVTNPPFSTPHPLTGPVFTGPG